MVSGKKWGSSEENGNRKRTERDRGSVECGHRVRRIRLRNFIRQDSNSMRGTRRVYSSACVFNMHMTYTSRHAHDIPLGTLFSFVTFIRFREKHRERPLLLAAVSWAASDCHYLAYALCYSSTSIHIITYE